MGGARSNRQKYIVRSIYYLTTIVALGVSGWALRYAYLYLLIPFGYWIPIYILIAAYLIGAIIFIVRRKSTFARITLQSLLLQIVPIVATILTFVYVPTDSRYEPPTGHARQYERYFNDLQPAQKRAALANGLAPFESRADIEEQYKKLCRQDKLVHIESNTKYTIKPLTHSSPYVVPKVEKLLDDLADKFQEATQSRSKFVVTSVLRTVEDAKRLNKSNVNASLSSCHCNATTIDISYVRFDEDELRPRGTYELRIALAKALYELRKQGRCYVKIERKQYCYHITVR